MSASNFIVGPDIGTHAIKAAIFEAKNNQKNILASLIKMPTAGIRRGTVDNIVDATRSLSDVMSEIKKISRHAIKNIYLSVGTPDIRIQSSRGVVAVSRADDEIFEDDIARCRQSAMAVSIPANRTILHSVVKEYIVDNIGGIRDPLGMVGKRLEVNTFIIDAFTPSIKNLEKCVETLGGTLTARTFSPLAAGEAVLTKNQKELGVMLIDIGFSKTCLSVYEEGQLRHIAVIPVGASNLTNDLAIGLRIPIETAEAIKLSYGSALAKEVSAKDSVELNKIDSRGKGIISKKFVAEILEDRLAEIFELVNNEVKHIGKVSQLPAGAVIVGGGVKIPNLAELARQELKLSAQIGIPDLTRLNAASGDLSAQAEDPEYATAIGLPLFNEEENDTYQKPTRPAGKTLRKILNYFIP